MVVCEACSFATECARSCKQGVELSGLMKGGVVLGQLSYYQLDGFSVRFRTESVYRSLRGH